VVTATEPLELPRTLADEVVAHARAGLPDEACGILSGTGSRVTRFFPAVNGDPSPFRYSIESRDLLRIVTEIEDADEDILAIYHSHTQSPAFPSRTDLDLAFWPDAAYLIVSLATDPADLKAFSIRDGKIGRRQLQLVD
jgi:proteasome lid subunit RPN8/RPN11